MNHILIPRKQLSCFCLNTNIDEYLGIYTMDYIDKRNNGGTYSIHAMDIDLYTNTDGIIEYIGTNKYCYYKGTNLIGLSIVEIMEILDESYGVEDPDILDFDADDISQYVYNFDKSDIQVWCKHGKALTIIMSNFLEDI